MKKKYMFILIILVIIIALIMVIKNKPATPHTIFYDHSNKNIKKDELSKYEDCKDCKINKKIDGSATEGEYIKIFNKDEIQDVYITIAEKNLYYLFENAIDKPQVFINNIKIGKYNIPCSSLKTKGYLTLRSLWHTEYNKFSLTVNFKKYLKDQNLFGLTKVSFNNMYTDPSMVKEYISYYLFNEMGVDTPEYSYINLYINKEYYGTYFMIEPIEKPLIKRTLNESGDFLIKPERDESDLRYNKELDKYLDENGEYNFDSLVYNDKNEFTYPKSSNNLLNKNKGIWEDDEETFKKIYKQLPTFFKTIKTLNELSNSPFKNTESYEKALESIVDVDKLIRYFAVDTYLVNTDGYNNHFSKNYALYMNKDGFITILPWDYNMILGTDYLNDVNDVINFDIYNPLVDAKLEEKPLFNAIIGNDNYKKKYEQYLKDVTIIATNGGTTSFNKKYDKNNLENMINNYSNQLIKNNNKSPQHFYDSKEIKTAQDNIKEILKLRSKAVLDQISNKTDSIRSDIDINTLGSSHT